MLIKHEMTKREGAEKEGNVFCVGHLLAFRAHCSRETPDRVSSVTVLPPGGLGSPNQVEAHFDDCHF